MGWTSPGVLLPRNQGRACPPRSPDLSFLKCHLSPDGPCLWVRSARCRAWPQPSGPRQGGAGFSAAPVTVTESQGTRRGRLQKAPPFLGGCLPGPVLQPLVAGGWWEGSGEGRPGQSLLGVTRGTGSSALARGLAFSCCHSDLSQVCASVASGAGDRGMVGRGSGPPAGPRSGNASWPAAPGAWEAPGAWSCAPWTMSSAGAT